MADIQTGQAIRLFVWALYFLFLGTAVSPRAGYTPWLSHGAWVGVGFAIGFQLGFGREER